MALKQKIFNPEFAIVTLFSLVSMIGVGFGMFFIGREQGYEEMRNEVEEMEAEVKRLENIVAELEKEDPGEPETECNCEEADEEETEGWIRYEDDKNSVSFQYPQGWVLTQEKPADTQESSGQLVTKVTSPEGSEFIYFSAEVSPGGVGGGCSLTDLDGLDSPYHAKCTLVEGENIIFARVKDPASEDILGKWLIAEQTEVGDLLTPDPKSNFSYQVAVEEDLEVLDSILSSVSRE